MHRSFLAAATAAALLLPAAQATAAGRCGDPAQRPWCDTKKAPSERADLLLKALTREERIQLLAGDELSGVGGGEGQHTGTLNGVPRVGLPSVFFSDGPVGTRQGKATGMPSPMALAASFSEATAKRHAAVVGDEVKRKGNDVVYAPAVNMLRTARNGRTFEYFGEDPHLAARMAVAWTKGVQETGVIGNIKHFAVNNQEGIGAQPPNLIIGVAAAGSRMTVDARVSERALREIYLHQFEAAVKEGDVGSVMCSYNRINGQYGCENEHLLEEVLKEDWKFDGFVLTDYGAAKNTIASLQNGLDLDIWPAQVYRPELVEAALATGQVTMRDVDQHVHRLLRTLFKYGFFDRDAFEDDTRSIDVAGHHAEAAAVEEQGIVLLENDGGILPLDPKGLKKVALIGPEADRLKDGGGSSQIDEFTTTTPRQALTAKLGADKVVFDDGSDRARAAAVAKAADVAIVVVGDRMLEGIDKTSIDIDADQQDGFDRDALVDAVASAQPNTIAVLQTGGPVLTPWRDKVRGLVEMWFPGQNGGTAIARVLLGETEPGGRLPATFPVSEADSPVTGTDPESYPGLAETVRYKEDVLIGYRWFDDKGKPVAYPFGYGLTYTTFRYSGLRLEPGDDATVSAVVENTGRRTGTAVPQAYVGMPDPVEGGPMPPWQLKAFDKVTLKPGERRRVTFRLDERAFSTWSEAQDRFVVTRGCYRIGVGPHSRDLPLTGTIGRGTEACEGALQLPAGARDCTSKRRFTIRLPKGIRRGARVTVAGKAVRVRRSKGRLVATVDLRRRKAGRVTVRVSGRSASGRTVKQTRVYRTCARRA